jgi:hypothetical protein
MPVSGSLRADTKKVEFEVNVEGNGSGDKSHCHDNLTSSSFLQRCSVELRQENCSQPLRTRGADDPGDR